MIKPEEEVTITITYGELLRAVMVTGHSNGVTYDKSIYDIGKDLLDLDDADIRKYVTTTIDYYSIQDELEAKVFGPKETEQERNIRELREQAEELLAKARELEENACD